MYKFYFGDNKVICVTTYAGKTVRGVAKCDPRDSFDLETGKALAKARADVKVAEKRYNRADRKVEEALYARDKAEDYVDKMYCYLDDAESELFETRNILDRMEERL